MHNHANVSPAEPSDCLPSQSPVAQVGWADAAARAGWRVQSSPWTRLAVSQLLTAAAGTAEDNTGLRRDFLRETRKGGRRRKNVDHGRLTITPALRRQYDSWEPFAAFSRRQQTDEGVCLRGFQPLPLLPLRHLPPLCPSQLWPLLLVSLPINLSSPNLVNQVPPANNLETAHCTVRRTSQL